MPPPVNRRNSKPVSVLSCHLSSQPTPWKRAGSPFILPDVPVYLVLQALVPSPPCVATERRELLPHGFTLTLSGGLFSVTAFIRLLPSVLSTAGRPFLSGLSSAAGATATGHSTLFLSVSELALYLLILSVQSFDFLPQFRSNVFAMLVALH